MFLFFDTETTGLSRKSDRIVQLAWLLTDDRGAVIETQNHLIKPEGFDIPTFATRVHGISTARAHQHGKSLDEVITLFCEDVRKCSIVVGHNISFDTEITHQECTRIGLAPPFEMAGLICTMKLSANWCRIPKYNGSKGFKWPTLQELHIRLFGEPFESAHDALADVMATKKCFFALVDKDVIILPRVEPLTFKTSVVDEGRDLESPSRTAQIICPSAERPVANTTSYADKLFFYDDEFVRITGKYANILAMNPTCGRLFLNSVEMLHGVFDSSDSLEVLFGEVIAGASDHFADSLNDATSKGVNKAVDNAKMYALSRILDNLRSFKALPRLEILGRLSGVTSAGMIMFGSAPAIAYAAGVNQSLVAQVIMEGVLYHLPRIIEQEPFRDIAEIGESDVYVNSCSQVLAIVIEAIDTWSL